MEFSQIEKKWQQFWRTQKSDSVTEDYDKEKYYVLSMFPYPSAAGLHVGHPMGYIASDVFARYKRLKGFNVLHPMGFDAFGLPAEQYAVKTGQHPATTTEANISTYIKQLSKIGLSYDWDRAIKTSDPSYYKWTQWIFLKLFNSWYNPATNKAEPIETLVQVHEKNNSTWSSMTWEQQQTFLLDYRLAYLADVEVNWCEELGTVLANEEVINGFSERGDFPVVKRDMKQWCLRITAYKSRLLEGLDSVSMDWSESVKTMQRNWLETLRDSVFSRQRYWGEPIPIYYKNGLPVALPEQSLPLILPETTDFTPTKEGKSPLAKVEEWKYDGCQLETNTMPGWAGSSWYYLRYMDANNNNSFASADAINYWKQIDLYVGGSEHTTGHLLYIRFWTKFLFDLGYLPFDEPVKKLVNQGMILGENGEKMSKSKGNVVNPDSVIEQYGADAFRIYEMFLGDITQNKPWNTDNINGSHRFITKFVNLFDKCLSRDVTVEEATVLNNTIESYEQDMQNLGMNTCISTMMKAVNYFTKQEGVCKDALKVLTLLIAPFAPHVAEEQWQILGFEKSVFSASFPVKFANAFEKTSHNYPVMVDGKKRGELNLSLSLTREDILAKVEEMYSNLYTIQKVYIIQGKIINIATK